MTFTAALQTSQVIAAVSADEMAVSVVLVEIIVKQQQLLKQQQGLISRPDRELEALKKEKETQDRELEALKKENA